MTFSEAVKKNTEEKYQKLVSGESESITKGMKIASSDKIEYRLYVRLLLIFEP